MPQSTNKFADRPSLPPADSLKALPPAALAGLACDAAAAGDVNSMRALVEAGVSIDLGTPYDQRTPLHLAAASGNLEMAQFLIEECGATLQRDRFGLLPIHDAVQNGHVEVRRYLRSKRVLEKQESRPRSKSIDESGLADVRGGEEAVQELMSSVFELVVKEGVFSYSTCHAEVEHFFKRLRLHRMYFEHFTPLQIAKHIHCLIAAKHVARATDDPARMDFVFRTENSGFFLTTIDCPTPTEAQKRTQDKVAKCLTASLSGKSHVSLKFMASTGPAMIGGKERLGIFATSQSTFDASRWSEDETSLEILASAAFLKEKTRVAKEQYQIMMEDVVASRRGVVHIVPGLTYAGPDPGFVVLFGTGDTAGRHYFPEICQAMQFVGLEPRRFYVETFVNGVIIYSIFLPFAKEAEVQHLKRTIMFSTLLNSARSDVAYNSVLQGLICHEVGLYLAAAVKFVYVFFPKEQYAPEYTKVHQILEQQPAGQRKLEALYKLCMKELLSIERIWNLVQPHLGIIKLLFEDFRCSAQGQSAPRARTELAAAIDQACSDPQDRQIMQMFLTFNESIILTNFFQEETPGAFAFRLNPAVVLKNRPSSLYPEIPYGIYLVSGHNFLGFHCRFRDVARGGIRLVLSRDQAAYERNFATLFDECYNLSLTQQYKNKDIPEGGAKGVILPDVLGSSQSPISQRLCFTHYLDALLDCMMPEQSQIHQGHMQGRSEILFFGPDENTAGFMDMGAELAKVRGYPYWKALTTGKSVKLGGVPHDTYGMTTASVHTYVTELLRELGEDESSITKFQTGGPDGDLGSNEILVSKDRTIAIVDGSGVLYDPVGLNREELTRLAKRRAPVKEFSRSFLGKDGFLVTVDDTDVQLPNGTTWRTGAALRDTFHLTDYATADLFVPCGGRPHSVHAENVKGMFFAKCGSPKFRMIVEGANLFFSDGARTVLEKAGVHVFKDASTNKGGVTSSSLEVFAALALPSEKHKELLTFDPSASDPPDFYRTYVKQIIDTITENARQEFQAIWACNRDHGVPKVEATKILSKKINQMSDCIQENFKSGMSEKERDHLVRTVLLRAVPPLMLEYMGVDGIIEKVPSNYIDAVVGSWVAAQFVYRHGIHASEVAFFFFMRSFLEGEEKMSAATMPNPQTTGTKRPAPETAPAAQRSRTQ